MIQDIYPKKFDNQFKYAEAQNDDYVIVFRGQGKANTDILLEKRDGNFDIPTVASVEELVAAEDLRYLFLIDNVRYYICFDYCVDLSKNIPNNLVFEKISIFRRQGSNEFALASTTAFHLYTWYSKNRFCGMCGRSTVHDDKERALRCPECGNIIYPMIAPAVIIGLIKRKGYVEADGTVTDEDQILVSRYAFREYRGMALLAGFCEIGETAEQTVEREIGEEVGLSCKSISYYASQPWGIDSNLLLGYYAELDGTDEIRLDTSELSQAEWVTRGEIDEQTNLVSLTATMIENFRRGNI